MDIPVSKNEEFWQLMPMVQYCNHSDLTKGLIYGSHSIHLGININLL